MRHLKLPKPTNKLTRIIQTGPRSSTQMQIIRQNKITIKSLKILRKLKIPCKSQKTKTDRAYKPVANWVKPPVKIPNRQKIWRRWWRKKLLLNKWRKCKTNAPNGNNSKEKKDKTCFILLSSWARLWFVCWSCMFCVYNASV